MGSNSIGRVAVALAPPTTPADVNGIQVIYTAISAGYNQTDPIGLFQSTDQGGTWTQLAAAGISGTSSGGYAMDIAVDPASPGDGQNDVVFYGCQNTFKSVNAGATFTGINIGHADVHTWTCVPQPPGPRPSSTAAATAVSTCPPTRETRGRRRTKAGSRPGSSTISRSSPTPPPASRPARCRTTRSRRPRGRTPREWVRGTGGDGWDVAYDGSSPPVLYATSDDGALSVLNGHTTTPGAFCRTLLIKPG